MKIQIGKNYLGNLERVKSLVEIAIGDFPQAERHLINVNGTEVRIEPLSCPERCYECGTGAYPDDSFQVVISDLKRRDNYFLHKHHFS